MVSSYLETIRTCRDQIYEIQRKIRVRIGECDDFFAEEEVLYLDLVYKISEAEKEGGLEPSEAEELKAIMAEVKQSRQTIRQDIVGIFAS